MGMHSTLISIPKLANSGYTMVVDGDKANVYDNFTTQVTANKPPILSALRCNLTGLWKLDLEPIKLYSPDNGNNKTMATEEANVVFYLPSVRQTFLWYHAAAGFSTKETFLQAVQKGNFSIWLKLTTQLIHRHFPDSDKTTKGHIKGQRQGIRSTRPTELAEYTDNGVQINIEGESTQPETPPTGQLNDIFIHVKDLSEFIHMDQTGAFPFASQQGNRYIMVAVHLDANYIFVEPMQN